jgi:hypothetical protein
MPPGDRYFSPMSSSPARLNVLPDRPLTRRLPTSDLKRRAPRGLVVRSRVGVRRSAPEPVRTSPAITSAQPAIRQLRYAPSLSRTALSIALRSSASRSRRAFVASSRSHEVAGSSALTRSRVSAIPSVLTTSGMVRIDPDENGNHRTADRGSVVLRDDAVRPPATAPGGGPRRAGPAYADPPPPSSSTTTLAASS